MNTRIERRQQIREGLDSLRARLGASDNDARLNLGLLTSTERSVYDRLMEKHDATLDLPFSKFSDDGLFTMRALLRKAYDELVPTDVYSGSPRDFLDTQILNKINNIRSTN